MTYFVKNIQTADEIFRHQYSGTDINTLAVNIDSILSKEGYKLLNGIKGNGEYEKGNRVMRILFGAFVKYYKYSIRLKVIDEQNIELFCAKASSGMSGGLIGMGQVKKELKRLEQVLANF